MEIVIEDVVLGSAWFEVWKWESVAGIGSAVRKMLGNMEWKKNAVVAVSAEMVHGWADLAQEASDSAVLPISVVSKGLSLTDFSIKDFEKEDLGF